MATPIKDAIKAQQAVVLPDNVSQLIKPLSAREAHNFGWNAFTSVIREDLVNTPILNTHIADNAVTTSKVADTAITETKLATGSVGNTKIKANGVKTANVTDLNITKPKLSQAVQDQLDAVGGGSIINNPDDEDIETVGSVLKFKDRTSAGNQKGYKIIRQDFDFQNIPIGYDNSIWEIRHVHDLGGLAATLPTGVTLRFNGGKITNYGAITLNNTLIESFNDQAFDDSGSFISDTFNNQELKLSWFGSLGNDAYDNTKAMYLALSGASIGSSISVRKGIYLINSKITVNKKVKFTGEGVLKASFDTSEFFEVTANGVVFDSGLTFDGDDKAELAGIKFSDSEFSEVFRCKFLNFNGTAITANSGSTGLKVERNDFDNCQIPTTNQFGAVNVRASFCMILRNNFKDGDTTAISLFNSNHTIVQHNIVDCNSASSSGGIIIDASTSSTGCVIDNNIIKDAKVEGIQVVGALTEDFSVSGNIIQDAQAGGITIGSVWSVTRRAALNGNIITAVGATSTYPYAILLTKAEEISITGGSIKRHERGIAMGTGANKCFDITITGVTVRSTADTAIQAFCEGGVITGNFLHGSGSGFSGKGVRADVGLGSEDLIIGNNFIFGFADGISADVTGSNSIRFLNNTFKDTTTELNLIGASPDTAEGNSISGVSLSGTVTINGTTSVSVANANITTNSKIKLFQKTPLGTEGAVFISSITAGVGFNVKSTNAGDTSVYSYIIDI